jgi:hypothetical protein
MLCICRGGIDPYNLSCMFPRTLTHSGLILAVCAIGIAMPLALYGLASQGLAVWGAPAGALYHGTAASDAALPFRAAPPIEQFAVLLTFFGFKFIYTLGAVAIYAVLWRRAEADLAALRRSMLAFFVGEMCCFVNVMAFNEHSFLLEHIHSVGMVLTFGYFVFALLEGLDRRLIHFSDDGRCAAAGLCRGCIKKGPAACGLRRVFLCLIPATGVFAAIPLFSSFREYGYNTQILHLPHVYRHPLVHQYYELRYLPVAGLVLLAMCFVWLLLVERRPVPVSKALFAAAIGAIGYSYFRFILVAAFIDNQVWLAAWEETTELLFVTLAGGVLLIFRQALFLDRSATETAVG